MGFGQMCSSLMTKKFSFFNPSLSVMCNFPYVTYINYLELTVEVDCSCDSCGSFYLWKFWQLFHFVVIGSYWKDVTCFLLTVMPVIYFDSSYSF